MTNITKTRKIYYFYLAGILFFTLFISNSFAGSDNESIRIIVTPQQIFQGDVVVLTILPTPYVTSAKYIQNNRAVPFYYDNSTHAYTAVLGIDLESLPGVHGINIKTFTASGLEINNNIDLLVQKKDFQTQHLTLPESKVTLSGNNLARQEREQAIVNRIFLNISSEKFRNTSFIKPLQGIVATPFGVQRFMNNKPKNAHSGVDFKAPAGAPVVASNDGIISYTGEHFFSGNSIFIDHGLGIFTMYFHLSSILVKPGEKVKKGNPIGLVGSTGRSTGPHLHWGMRINNQRVDPLTLPGSFKE
ncbi:MAG: M23 family metallopeptidase [Pseudomonadota bacterium]